MDWKRLEQKLPMLYGKYMAVYDQGDEAERFYYLKRGSVRIYLSSELGNERTLTVVKSGELFGEAAFFDRLPRVSSAKTLEKSEIIAVDRPMLAQIFKEEPAFAMKLLEYLAHRVRMLSAQVDSLSFLPADERLAELLLQLCDEEGIVQTTHEQLADLAGVSRITVSKTLSRFAKEGWVSTGYRRIFIANRKKLQSFTR